MIGHKQHFWSSKELQYSMQQQFRQQQQDSDSTADSSTYTAGHHSIKWRLCASGIYLVYKATSHTSGFVPFSRSIADSFDT